MIKTIGINRDIRVENIGKRFKFCVAGVQIRMVLFNELPEWLSFPETLDALVVKFTFIDQVFSEEKAPLGISDLIVRHRVNFAIHSCLLKKEFRQCFLQRRVIRQIVVKGKESAFSDLDGVLVNPCLRGEAKVIGFTG